MANEQNLIPLNKRSKSEQREIQSSGGKARAKKINDRKIFKEVIEEYLGIHIDDIVLSMINEAKKKGNVQAAIWLRDTAHQKPKEQLELSGNVGEKIEEIDSYVNRGK